MFYLDNAATTPVLKEVLEVSLPYLSEHFANPSSVYSPGIEASKAIKAARESLAKVFHVSPEGIVFCSGATESNYLAFMGCAFSQRVKGKQVVISSIEHASVIKAAEFLKGQGYQLLEVPVSSEGIIDLEFLERSISEETSLVSCIAVSNEVGILQPLEDAGALIKKKNPKTLFHVDATQAVGKVSLPIKSAKIDLLSLSGHKFGAPKGIGALMMTRPLPIVPVMEGGGQENGWRGGTENVFGIVSLGEAVKLAESNRVHVYQQMLAYRQEWVSFLRQYPELYIYDSPYILPFYLNIAFPSIPAEVFLHHLEAQQIYVSTGSACSSKKSRISHVWEAIGISPKVATSMIRLSFSKQNLDEDRKELFDRFSAVMDELKSLSAF